MKMVVGAAMALAALASTDVRAAARSDAQGRNIEFATIEHAVDGPYSQGMLIYVRTEAEWNAAVESMAASGALSVSPVEAPHVNWNKQGVVLVAIGECPTYGFDVQITKVTRSGRKALIEVNYVSPGNGAQIQGMTAPFHIISFDKANINSVEITQGSLIAMGPMAVSPSSAQSMSTDGDDASMVSVSWGDLKSRF